MTRIKPYSLKPLDVPIVHGGVVPFIRSLPVTGEKVVDVHLGLPINADLANGEMIPEAAINLYASESVFVSAASDFTEALETLPPELFSSVDTLPTVGTSRFQDLFRSTGPVVRALSYAVPILPLVITGAALLTGSSQTELTPAPLLGVLPFAILSPLMGTGGGEEIITYSRHPIVTGRSIRKILRLLKSATTKFNKLASSGSVREVPILSVDGLVGGPVPRSVLSVGEGDSSFVHRLIELRAKHLGKASGGLSPVEAPYFAVDRVYPDEQGQFIAPRVIAEDRRAAVVYSSNPYHSQHPAHYRQGHAQDFKLMDPMTGELMQFDEVVSLVSVGRFMHEEFMRSEEAGRLLLLNLLNHTKPGGHLRIVPVTVPLFGGKAFRKRLNDTLSDLQNEGVIDFYNSVSFRNNFLIIRKAEPVE